MTAKQNLASAVSQTPSDRNEGPTIFLDPQAVCNSVSGDPKELLNEAMLFHESLHGYYGLIDPILQSDFGLDEARPSVNITYYLDQNVLESVLFHEALHGMTGASDGTIEQRLGTVDGSGLFDSTPISKYIKNNVLQYCPSFTPGK